MALDYNALLRLWSGGDAWNKMNGHINNLIPAYRVWTLYTAPDSEIGSGMRAAMFAD